MDSTRRKKIVSNEEMAAVDAGTMAIALASKRKRLRTRTKKLHSQAAKTHRNPGEAFNEKSRGEE
jgi:hypothetical protein